METVTTSIDTIKRAASMAANLENLRKILDANDGANVLGNRPDSESDLGWMPVFDPDSDHEAVGNNYEVISWDKDSILFLRYLPTKDASNTADRGGRWMLDIEGIAANDDRQFRDSRD